MAQKEANWWYFGGYAGADFNTTPTTGYSNGAMFTGEGVATYSDRSTGGLLFYTNGVNVWNRNHNQMANGTGLGGSITSSQSAMIVPNLSNNNKYFIFTVPTTPLSTVQTPCYSEVDMSLNGGLGDVVATTRNTVLDTITVADKIAACTDSAVCKTWVVYQNFKNWDMHAYEVATSGVLATPVVTSVPNPTGFPVPHVGCMKFSTDGTRLAAACKSRVLLFDFNTSTGALSNQITLNFPAAATIYGVEFSFNTDYLYVSVWDSLLQFDLTAGTTAATIYASRTLIRSGFGTKGSLQLAMDKKLYVANPTSVSNQVLSVIEKPNRPGLACSYKDTGLVIPATARSTFGLPAFITSIFAQPFLELEDGCKGEYVQVSLLNTNTIDSVLYDFGDTSSSNNTSWNKLDSHRYNAPGWYTVTAYAYRYNACKNRVVIDTIIDSLEILDIPEVVLPSDTTICKADSIQGIIRNAQYASPYELFWPDSSQGNWFTIDTVGQYILSAVNRCGLGSDTVKVDSLFKNALDLGNDTLICLGDTLVLNMSDTSASYLWSTGDTASIYAVDSTAIIWGQSTNFCGVMSDTIKVEAISPPTANAGNDTAYCGNLFTYAFVGEPFANRYSTYRWSNNATTFKIQAVSGWYALTETNQCGSDTDSVFVIRESGLQALLGPDSVICSGDSIVLDPLTKGADLVWNSNSLWTDSVFVVTTGGSYWLNATNSCGTYRDTIVFDERSTPEISLPKDTTICLGDSVTLEIKWPHTNFLWNTNSTISRIWAKSTGAYWVRASNQCGVDSDTILVQVNNQPNVQLPNDTVLCDKDDFFITASGNYINNVLWNTGNLGLKQLVNEGGIYSIQVSNACGSDSDTILVEHLFQPRPNLGPDTTICNGHEIELRTNIPEDILDYTTVLWNRRFTSKELYVEREDWYRVEVENKCGTGRDTIKVDIAETPTLGRNLDTIICNDFVDFDFRSSGLSLLWDDGSEDQFYRVSTPGEYIVELWDSNGCYGLEYFTVRQCASKLWVPKAFSPNFDGTNETFRAYKDQISFYEIEIYDRWNKLVFTTDQIDFGWDGTVHNDGERRCAQGSYVWKIRFTEIENNQMQIVTGEVSLIR